MLAQVLLSARLAVYGQDPDTQSIIGEHEDGSGLKVVANGVEVINGPRRKRRAPIPCDRHRARHPRPEC